LFAQALRRGGNTHYAFRFFAGADHAAHVSPDGGVTRGPALAPGYAELVGSWIRDVTSGHLPNADAQTPPKQDYPSTDAPPSARWESGRIQLAAFVLFVVAFIAYPLVALVRRLRGRTVQPVSRWAPLLAGAGFASTGLLWPAPPSPRRWHGAVPPQASHKENAYRSDCCSPPEQRSSHGPSTGASSSPDKDPQPGWPGNTPLLSALTL
jgi:hypothetical protein